MNKNITAAFNYPEGYYDFSKGVDATEQTHPFIKDCVKQMIKDMDTDANLKQSHYTWSTGNTLVMGEIYRGQQPGDYSIIISVTQNYKKFQYHGPLTEI